MKYKVPNTTWKQFTEEQIDQLIKLKFGALVTKLPEVSYVSNKVLAKIYNCSESHIRKLYTDRFEKIALKERPLLEQMKHARAKQDR